MKNTNINKSIGILGGMGPQASAKLLEVLINMCSSEYGARTDYDFPEVVLSSVNVPEFISEGTNIKPVLDILKKRVRFMEQFDPACFGIACNTAHVLLPELQKTTSVPFISIMEEVSREAESLGIRKVGIMSTPMTVKNKLYSKKLGKIDLIVPTAKEQITIEFVIRNVLANKAGAKEEACLVRIAENLEKRGAEGIILGCTELPLIFPKDFPLPVFDSIEILARGLLRKFYENRSKNDIINSYEN